jgi:alcohol dehydrogenase
MDLPAYYEFCCRVKIIAGHGVLEKIPEALSDLNAGKPMIITDKGVAGAGLIEIVIDSMKNRIAIGAIADDVPTDSELRVVNRLAKIYRESGCDSIIAVGGGSVLDTAKGVNIIVSEKEDDLMKFSGANRLKRNLKPLIAIPTTAGTGSEVTLVAVIKDQEKHRKMAFTSNFLLPDVSIIDPCMTLTLPPVITAATGMDALSHAVEAYTCLAKNPLSDAHALAAIDLIAANLLHVTKNPDDKNGRLAMANAATLAGMAFSNSMVGMVHAIGHSVGSVCGVPHGACMAIFLPYGLEYNLHRNSRFTSELLLPLAGPEEYSKTPVALRAGMAIARIRQINQALHDATGGKHARFLKEVMDRNGKTMVAQSMFPEITKTAMGDGSILYNPEELDHDDLMMVLEAAWEGRPLDASRLKKG